LKLPRDNGEITGRFVQHAEKQSQINFAAFDFGLIGQEQVFGTCLAQYHLDKKWLRQGECGICIWIGSRLHTLQHRIFKRQDKTLLGVRKHQVDFKWIKGHNNHPQNERCDELAVMASNQNTLSIDTFYEKEDDKLF